MFLYFDKKGTLKEVLEELPARVGSYGVNKVYAYFENKENVSSATFLTDTGGIEQIVSDTTNIMLVDDEDATGYFVGNTKLEYFKLYKAYAFYVCTLTTADLQQGRRTLTVRAVQNDDTIIAQGDLIYNVQNSVVQADESIGQNEYDYLIARIANLTTKLYVDTQDQALQSQIDANNAKLTKAVDTDLLDGILTTELTANDNSKLSSSTNFDTLYYKKSQVYNKTESDAKYPLKTDVYAKGDTYSKTEIDSANATQNTAITNAQNKANEAYELAKSGQETYTFDTIEEMETALENDTENTYQVGDILLIKSTGVPMFVVIDDEGTEYGHYDIERKETDLSAYQTKTDNNLTTTSKTIVGAINELKSEQPDLSDYATLDTDELENYTKTSDLGAVALSNSYNDLSNKPTIPEGVIVDQSYDETSENAQSGTAVAEAISDLASQSDLSALSDVVDSKANSSDVYDKDTTDSLLDLKADASSVYTQTQTDTLLSGKVDTTRIATDQLLGLIKATFVSSTSGLSDVKIDSNGKLYVAPVPTLDVRPVSVLPQTGESGVIYLVPHTAQSGDLYDEYIWVNNAWEHIGGATIDLSGLQTKQDNNLETTSKQIVGAINELNSGKQSTLSTSNKLNTDYINTSSSVRFTSDTEINSKQDKLPTITNDRYLHTNSSTGALEWVEVQGGGTEFLETEISLVELPEEEPEPQTYSVSVSSFFNGNNYSSNFAQYSIDDGQSWNNITGTGLIAENTTQLKLRFKVDTAQSRKGINIDCADLEIYNDWSITEATYQERSFTLTKDVTNLSIQTYDFN